MNNSNNIKFVPGQCEMVTICNITHNVWWVVGMTPAQPRPSCIHWHWHTINSYTTTTTTTVTQQLSTHTHTGGRGRGSHYPDSWETSTHGCSSFMCWIFYGWSSEIRTFCHAEGNNWNWKPQNKLLLDDIYHTTEASYICRESNISQTMNYCENMRMIIVIVLLHEIKCQSVK